LMRVIIAFVISRAILHKSDLLLLDEPFKSLDFSMAMKIQMKILSLWKKYDMTVIMVSHDPEEAIFLSDKILILSKKPSKIKKVINVDLPRPRTTEMHTQERFNNLREELLNEFKS